jgi:hypothetical protein
MARNFDPYEENTFDPKAVLWWGVGAVIIAAIGTVIYFSIASQSAVADLDPETLCKKSGPTAIVDVLIDRTDGLNVVQALALKKHLLSWAEDVPENGIFQVYEVREEGVSEDPLISICNPGSGKDKSKWTSNQKLWGRKYEEKYRTPIADLIDKMELDGEAKTSPILEAIQAVSVRDFEHGSASADKLNLKRIYIVSDLLQNTAGLSLYKALPNVRDFLNSPYGRSMAVDLSSIEVEIWTLNRANTAGKQNGELLKFWEDWLTSLGSDAAPIQKIPG